MGTDCEVARASVAACLRAGLTPKCARSVRRAALLGCCAIVARQTQAQTAGITNGDRLSDLVVPPFRATAGQIAGNIIRFAGHGWTIKTTDSVTVEPGPGFYGGQGIHVDQQGLHLKAAAYDGRFICAEIVSQESFGHGTYTFDVAPEVAALDRNLVLGMFTWSREPEYAHREIDIELSRWGKASNDNAQFVVQPHTEASNIVRFMVPVAAVPLTFVFTWTEDSVAFEARSGDSLLKHAVLVRRIPSGAEHARINLWTTTGGLARDGTDEVLIRNFSFVPLKSTAGP